VLLSLEEKHQPSFRFIYYFRFFFSFSGRVWLVKEKGRECFWSIEKIWWKWIFLFGFYEGEVLLYVWDIYMLVTQVWWGFHIGAQTLNYRNFTIQQLEFKYFEG
jgi:hypothetical protein